MDFKVFTKHIVKIKHLKLLGDVSHAKLSPPYRKALAEKMKAKYKTAKTSAVLVLFYPDETNITKVVFILRKRYKGVHSAQVGFPGGKFEITDTNFKHTALRETEEEVGVLMRYVEVQCALSPIYIPPSNFMVYPYLGLCKSVPHFTKQDSEVDAIIEVDLDDILNENTIVNTPITLKNNTEVLVPAFQLNGFTVWGATAMMLSEVKDLLKQLF